MKFSKETLDIMSNFASVNQNLALMPGGRIETVAPERNIRVDAAIVEDFPSEFYIYDLTTFLGVLNLLPDAEIKFSKTAIDLVDGTKSLRYGCADKSILMLPNGTRPNMTEYVNFKMDDSTISAVRKASAILGLPNLRISGNGKTITASVMDLKNPSPNTYDVQIGETDKTFNADFLISSLKLMSGSYNVSLDPKYISKWSMDGGDYTMYIAMTQTSKFE